VKRSDNASILGGHSTPDGERMIADAVGLTIVSREYSECQAGKDICDRIAGAAKGRLRAFLHAGHDVICASDMKKGMKWKDFDCHSRNNLSTFRHGILQWCQTLESRHSRNNIQ
jgi:hypothetical protein